MVAHLHLYHLLSLVCLSPVRSMIPGLILIISIPNVSVDLIGMVTDMAISMDQAISIIIIIVIIILMSTTIPTQKTETIRRNVQLTSKGAKMGTGILHLTGMGIEMEKGTAESMEEGMGKGTEMGKSMGVGVVLPMVGTNIMAAHQKNILDQSQYLPHLQGLLGQCSSFIWRMSLMFFLFQLFLTPLPLIPLVLLQFQIDLRIHSLSLSLWSLQIHQGAQQRPSISYPTLHPYCHCLSKSQMK